MKNVDISKLKSIFENKISEARKYLTILEKHKQYLREDKIFKSGESNIKRDND